MYSCKRRARKRKENFEVPDSSLVVFDTVSSSKTRLSAGDYCLHFQEGAVEE